ncbi:hypothetical protein [Arthrobacter sp. CJ23]|nr:hypothetical protein [Arthrobacter sp. CJ23]UVJ41713.1 hypothetical protein NVV90_16205 [Arthrobacter sp. CJ23]
MRISVIDCGYLGAVHTAWMAKPNGLDGRNALDAAEWRAAGWHYRGLGRP